MPMLGLELEGRELRRFDSVFQFGPDWNGLEGTDEGGISASCLDSLL